MIPCRECGNGVSDEAAKCPSCGAGDPVGERAQEARKAQGCTAIGCGTLALIVLIWVFVSARNPEPMVSAEVNGGPYQGSIEIVNTGDEAWEWYALRIRRDGERAFYRASVDEPLGAGESRVVAIGALENSGEIFRADSGSLVRITVDPDGFMPDEFLVRLPYRYQ